MLIATLGWFWQAQDLLDVVRANLADNPDLADPKESVFLDIQPILTILKTLPLPQPLTSIQEVPYEQTHQNVQALLLAGRFPCRELSDPHKLTPWMSGLSRSHCSDFSP
jgi:hypothetical protein